MNNNNILLLRRREDYRLDQMSSNHDIPFSAMPVQKYCIASTPRSGSTLISRMLHSSQLAGDPKEYLNPLLINAWFKINNKNISFNDYIKELKSRRTTSNGFFGMKIHGRHLSKLSKMVTNNDINSLLNDFDKFIFVSRSDKLSQAISYYFSKSTGIFHSEQEQWIEEFKIPKPSFNAVQISSLLSDLLHQEMLWESILEKINKPVYKITYEDLVSNYQLKAKEIFNFLEIDATAIPTIPTRKMNKFNTQEFRDLFLNRIGF